MSLEAFVPERPIYPVPIKPDSGIRSWRGWPDDVRPVLEAWNRYGARHSLSFRHSRLFKCPDCGEFCKQHNGAVLDSVPICDDCLIARVRKDQR